MTLFLSLYLGHVLGDFVFQPGRLVIAKRSRLSGVLLHTAIVTICIALVLVRALPRVWPAVVATGVGHLAVELLTIRARRASGASGLAIFLIDQGAHMVILAIIALAASALVSRSPVPLPLLALAPLATACGVATVAFFGSILIFEIEVTGGWVPEAQGIPILALDGARIYGMGERALALIAALSPTGPALGLLAFAPRAAYIAAFAHARRARHVVALVTGVALCAMVWILIVVLRSVEGEAAW